jgi:streptogramin lyase
MDGDGGLWLANNSQTNEHAVVRVDTETLDVEVHPVVGSYGITVDPQGRIWTTIGPYISRYDPVSETAEQVDISDGPWGFARGIAAGVGASEGTVWVADTFGAMLQIDQETMEVIETVVLDGSIVGAAVDFEGNAWGISLTNNRAYKVDPETYAFEYVTIGQSPYTYSDMTGMQLKQAVDPE